MINSLPPGQALALMKNTTKKEGVVKITAIYDNGGKTLDRYTVVTDEMWSPSLVAGLGLSKNPSAPDGFSQWTGCMPGRHLGRRIRFEDLSQQVQAHITKRVLEDE